jgi:hypothetical protein
MSGDYRAEDHQSGADLMITRLLSWSNIRVGEASLSKHVLLPSRDDFLIVDPEVIYNSSNPRDDK